MVPRGAKRKIHAAAFKAHIALAAVKRDRKVNELAVHYGVHPTLMNTWKKLLRAEAEGRSLPVGGRRPLPGDDRTPELYE